MVAKDEEKKAEEEPEEVPDEEDSEDEEDLDLDDDDLSLGDSELMPQSMPFFVNQKLLEEIKAKIAKDEAPTEKELVGLVKTEELPDEDLVVPVDLNAINEAFGDDEDQDFQTEEELVGMMVKKKGVKETAKAFIKAEETLKEEAAEAGEDVMEPMTVKEMKELMDMDSEELDGDLEDSDDDDEELDEDEDDDDDEEAEEAEEDKKDEGEGPPAKKAKTA